MQEQEELPIRVLAQVANTVGKGVPRHSDRGALGKLVETEPEAQIASQEAAFGERRGLEAGAPKRLRKGADGRIPWEEVRTAVSARAEDRRLDIGFEVVADSLNEFVEIL